MPMKNLSEIYFVCFSKFVGCSFVTCAIWQYESQRNKLRKVKERWQAKEKPKQISSQVIFNLERNEEKKNKAFDV
jgi:hypothetical protein